MPKTVFPEAIKSRPTYNEFSPRKALLHLFIADGEGAGAILDFTTQHDFTANSHIIYIKGKSGNKYIDALEKLNAPVFYTAPSHNAALSHIKKVLHNARMGTLAYIAGDEVHLSKSTRLAMNAGLTLDGIQREHRGSTARPMQCVHCKGYTDDVTTDPFVCSHCGLNLFVRDHYSYRLSSFQGVCIDAEDPGNIPKSVEVFK